MNAVFTLLPGMYAEDARCLDNMHVHKLLKCKAYKARIDGAGLNIKLAGEPPVRHARKVVLCEVERDNKISYLWADTVTGSLFLPQTGKCLTSSTLTIKVCK